MWALSPKNFGMCGRSIVSSQTDLKMRGDVKVKYRKEKRAVKVKKQYKTPEI
jgi:hypothetical protein